MPTDPDVKLTPLQIDIVEFLHSNEGDLTPWKLLAAKFHGDDGEADHRLSESVWGLIEAGLVFEPRDYRSHYHLTEVGARQAPKIVARRSLAVKEAQRDESKLTSRRVYDDRDPAPPTTTLATMDTDEPSESKPPQRPAANSGKAASRTSAPKGSGKTTGKTAAKTAPRTTDAAAASDTHPQ